MTSSRMPELYLDANATTPVWHNAARAAFEAMEELFGNPSSSHITGLRARSILESARSLARSALGANSGRIVFTSGATEAIQTAIFSSLCDIRKTRAQQPADNGPRYLLYGATEHKAVPQALKHWNELLCMGDEVLAIPVDSNGLLDLDFLQAHAGQADMVCTMAVNNETGVIHDLTAVEKIIRAASPSLKWMVDCVQAVGKLDLNLANSTIDYAPVSGHKIYAPKGIGLLYVRDGAPITPLLAGGGQEGGARGGTENLPGVAAIACILEHLNSEEPQAFANQATLESWRDRLVAALKDAFPTIVFNTPFEHAVPTTINFSVRGFSSKEILDLFDAASIRVSSGSACGSAIVGSFVLEAMGLPQWQSNAAVRMSFGPMTPEADIAAAEIRIRQAGKALAASCLVIGYDADESSGTMLDGLVQLKHGSACSWVLLDAESQRCVVIDPFAELADRIETLIRCQNSRVVAILDTHKHVDHESCRSMLLQALSDVAEPSALTSDILGWPEISAGSVQLDDQSSAEYLQIGPETILARTPLPGHTVDSLALLAGAKIDGCLPASRIRQAFTGDTIQIGGIGRTDFYSSSAEDQYNSLRRLPIIIAGSTLICPTHDYTTGFATTLEAEAKTNPLLANLIAADPPLSLDDFLQQKSGVDQLIDDDSNCELVCGHIVAGSCGGHSVDLRPEDMQNFFASHENSLIVDVREPHEFRFAQDWSALGLRNPPENIPLTRLCNFLTKVIADQKEEEVPDIIFLCRSGSRSSKAAEVMRRLGRSRVWHIKGGIALGTHHDSVEWDQVEYMI